MCALEAMALGTPVVSTPSDGMKDLIDSGVNGYLCQEDGDLAEALWKLATDSDHRQALSENAMKKFSEINDVSGYYKTIEACYR